MSNIIVIKLGGSVFSTNEDSLIDFNFLKKLKDTLTAYFQDKKFFIVTGGGKLARKTQRLSKEAGITNENDLHWIGTTANVLNAEIVRSYFGDVADSEVCKFNDYYTDKSIIFDKPIKLGGGGKPGHSGDVDAVLAALRTNSHLIISLKDVDGVYRSDPDSDPNAILETKLTWDSYLDIIGSPETHKPGASYPIDPIASRMAKDNNITFAILNGFNFENFVNFINDKEFKGTIIKG